MASCSLLTAKFWSCPNQLSKPLLSQLHQSSSTWMKTKPEFSLMNNISTLLLILSIIKAKETQRYQSKIQQLVISTWYFLIQKRLTFRSHCVNPERRRIESFWSSGRAGEGNQWRPRLHFSHMVHWSSWDWKSLFGIWQIIVGWKFPLKSLHTFFSTTFSHMDGCLDFNHWLLASEE